MDTIITVPSLMQEWDWTENGNKGYDPKRITLGSSIKAYWICSNGHKWQASVKNRVNGSACPYCSGKLPIVGETDLSTLYPNLAAEWHPIKNGSLNPNSVTVKSGKTVWWLGKCGHEWQSTVYHRTEGQNCPICSSHKLLKGYNDLKTLYPEIASEWHPTKNGTLSPSEVFSMSNRKVWWLGKCGHEWRCQISCRTKNGNGCPICSGYTIIPGVNDLLTINPSLAEEWDYERNDVSPSKISPNTHRKVWWRCPNCGYSWKADIHHRNTGVGCPVCGRKQATETRITNAISSGWSLAVANPILASEWNYDKNGSITPENVLPGSNQKVWWRCKKGHEWEALISSRNSGVGCPFCDMERKTSFPEQAIYYYFSKLTEVKNRRKVYGKEIDVFFPIINVGLEYDGSYYHSSERRKKNDAKKTAFLSTLGIRLIHIVEGNQNSIDNDIIEYKYDPKYTELPWAIKCFCSIIGIAEEIDIDLQRDRFEIYSQYINLEKANSLAARFPSIASEWHPTKNKPLKPENVSFGSNKSVWWLCKHGHEWEAKIYSRTNSKSGCPICSGKMIVDGVNDLKTKNPALAAEWDEEKNDPITPSMVSPFSHKKYWWKCSKCGYCWEASVKNRYYGTGCPSCLKSKRNHDGD